MSSCSSWPPSLASRSACSFPWIPQCAGIHCKIRFVWAARSIRAVYTSLRSFWRGFWSLLRTERASVMMMMMMVVMMIMMMMILITINVYIIIIMDILSLLHTLHSEDYNAYGLFRTLK